MATANANAAIDYSICPSAPAAHRLTVICSIAAPDPQGQVFSLPAWVPGSYLIRNFARHILAVSAQSRGNEVSVEQIDKQTWRCAPCSGPLLVRCVVHAHDASVRAAFVDCQRGLFNGTSVFFRFHGQEECPCSVQVEPPPAAVVGDWTVTTTLAPVQVDAAGFGSYRAQNYAALIDRPVVMGQLERVQFAVQGVPHEFVLVGRHVVDKQRLAEDLAALCSRQAAFWGALPVSRYVFIAQVAEHGYGGLEHGDCAVLQVARDALPVPHRTPGVAYRELLGLCSHEYFHLWNVKRIRPAAVANSQLDKEAYFADLWAYEGVTSYYDDLAVVVAGLQTQQDYLDKLARAATRLQRTPARHRQSLAQASLTAWIKFYQPDDNRPNAVVSYYNKGALLTLCLDLLLRQDSGGAMNLGHVMRAAWERYGRTGQPVPDGGLESLVCELAGETWRAFFDRAVRSTQELPLARALASVGINCEQVCADDDAALVGALGVELVGDVQSAQLRYVHDDSPAQVAGLSPGDVLVAVAGLRATAHNLGARLRQLSPGASFAVQLFRGDTLLEVQIKAVHQSADTWQLAFDADAGEQQLQRRRAWLGRA